MNIHSLIRFDIVSISLHNDKHIAINEWIRLSLGVLPGGSTVPAAVVIVAKYRACLSVGRLIVGV